jgi:hypothetical protein
MAITHAGIWRTSMIDTIFATLTSTTFHSQSFFIQSKMIPYGFSTIIGKLRV